MWTYPIVDIINFSEIEGFIGLPDFKVAGILTLQYLTKMCINKKRALPRFVKCIDQGRAGVFMYFHNFVKAQFC